MFMSIDYDDVRTGRRANGRGRVLLFVVGSALVLVACAALVAFAVHQRRQAEAALAEAEAGVVRRPVQLGGLPPAVEGENWTHKELAAYLNRQGVQLEIETDRVGGTVAPSCDFVGPDGGRLVVQKRASAAEARDQARASTLTFAWGRFLFFDKYDSPRFAASVKAALGVR